ncbi:phage tail protein [Lysobacter sp.]|uniref:phage tail protein n=1 Tax=Lysobacter sp. TaxID=72226 RepID=UPI002D5D029C|nr:phage tail protein [Lysobacter sp.]HZX78907.1 phage tail protein [Lysobacter sp.]
MPLPDSASLQGRADPYRDFRFRVKWDGRIVAGVHRISGLRRVAEVVEYRDGGDAGPVHKSPGRIDFEPVTLERAITHDLEFDAWARQSNGADTTALARLRRDVTIEVDNAQGAHMATFHVHRCWVSVYEVLPGLDALDGAAIERLTLQNEGWERQVAP